MKDANDVKYEFKFDHVLILVHPSFERAVCKLRPTSWCW